ncbi:uncharacterized protein LOC126722433 [Quercus robur]|uniref:uncharacterized protein LOC126722433 n=1 Tax=Quercus robur TaxID=38942 RepID=UPI002161AC54|nr:uncharacterized protein LOC126722433 [Quercus robur]
MTFYLLFLIPISSAGNRNANTIFGKKQKLEVQQHLKRLNKPALKSIKSPDGDIIDCVDINKQPAFDHPLLKNHTIQMRPSSYPEGFSFDEINDVSSNSEPEFAQPWHLNGRCPEGTIPIRRTKEEDLLRAGSVANFGRKKYHTIPNAQASRPPHEHAILSENGVKFYGLTADMNLWNPYVQEANEFSLSQFWLLNGAYETDLDTIEAGATVNERLYGDKNTRLFLYWTDDAYQSTGCYNLLCPGFVQVDKQIAMGAIVTPYSKYNGNQYALKFYVWKKVAAKDSSVSKGLEINNESSTTKTFFINSSPVMRNLRNEVPLIHPVSPISPSYLEVMPVMMTDTSTMEEKMIEMEQKVAFLTKTLEDKDVKIATLMNKLEVQDSGESSLDPKQQPSFTLKGENARVEKGKGVEDAS